MTSLVRAATPYLKSNQTLPTFLRSYLGKAGGFQINGVELPLSFIGATCIGQEAFGCFFKKYVDSIFIPPKSL
jgi:hypothetical protein